MADVITKFKLETTQFDSKLRDAAKGLSEVVHVAELGGKEFKGFSLKSIEAARSLGTIASGATNTKDRLRDLVGSYNDVVKAYDKLSAEQQKSDFGKAMSQSLEQLQQRIKQTKDELYGLGDATSNIKGGGGGLFSGDKFSGMLQVFGGNVMTKIAGAGLSLASELGDAVKQGIELAKQGEGIRIAFERLGRGDILQGLREATHGTVTDLELMKAAVKFNDFKLPLDELGTMLAFAQQKAKDTGQSVDYMVDSIVTGLGRKSLMILDNLGLSAAEIKDKMKETGDMTKAVGEIIREQMSKAGDYVETAADRATAANVELTNAITRLGETFSPLADTANSAWTSIKVGALDLLNNVIEPLINRLTEAGRLRAQLANINAGTGTSQTRAGKDLGYLKYEIGKYGAGSDKIEDLYNRQRGRYIQQQNQAWRQAQSARQKYDSLRESGASQADLQAYYQRWQVKEAEAKAWADVLKEYDEGAKKLMKPVDVNINADKAIKGVGDLKKKLNELEEQRKKAVLNGDDDLVETITKQINALKQNISYLDPNALKTGGKTVKTTAEKIAFDPNKAILSAEKGVDTMPSVWSMIMTNGKTAGVGDQGLRDMLGIGKQQTELGRILKEYVTDPDKNKRDKEENDEKNQATMLEGITAMNTSLQNIFGGIQQLGFEVPQELMDILSVMQTIVGIVSAIQTLSTVKLFGFAGGGIVKAFNGTLVGNTYSGDQLRGIDQSGQLYGLNAGEVVLNRAQVGNLASQLSGGMGQMQLEAVVRGEDLRFILNSNGRRTGRGEIVTTNFR